MQLGMVGLGRMGAGMVRRLVRGGHRCVVYDVNQDAVRKMTGRGIQGAADMAMLAKKLTRPRTVWVMVPAAVTERAIDDVAGVLDEGDVIIDGGNSYYRDDVARAAALKQRGIHFIDSGTSGGVFGERRGFCLMIGGEDAVVKRLTPLFRTIAPGAKAAPRTAGRKGALQAAEEGFLHCGPAGAGHFVKMVHNGIEYALMAAYAEGLNILRHADAGRRARVADAETAPLRDASYYRYNFDVAAIAEVWRRGSVISSWLLDLAADALADDPKLQGFAGRVSDSGEGRWTMAAAIDESVPAPVLGAALYERFDSQGGADFSNRLLSALRKEFGGHQEKAGRKGR